MEYYCPVCGFSGLDDDPRSSSHEICPCCAIQFGLDDEPEPSTVSVLVVGTDGSGTEEYMKSASPLRTKEDLWLAWRETWIKEGMQWFDGIPPNNWNPELQLKSAFNK